MINRLIIDWKPVQDVLHFSPNVSWDVLQPPTTLYRIRLLMDGDESLSLENVRK